MLTIHLVLLVFALVLAIVAAFWNPPGRPHLGWLAIAFIAAAMLVP